MTAVRRDGNRTIVAFDVRDQDSAVQKAEYSLDGEHWSELRLRRRGDRTFETKIKGGVLRSGDEISLRVDAVDTNGNGIAQTVTGIVAVR